MVEICKEMLLHLCFICGNNTRKANTRAKILWMNINTHTFLINSINTYIYLKLLFFLNSDSLKK